MKYRKIFVGVVLALLFSNCEEPRLDEHSQLDKEALRTVVASSLEFKNIIKLHIDFFREINQKYSALSDKDKSIIKDAIERVNAPDALFDGATEQERNIFLYLSSRTAHLLKPAYISLLGEINVNYFYSESDLQELIIENVLLSKYGGSFRQQISCAGNCSNKAEEYYWYLFKGTKNSDLAAFGATSFYSGCLTGCNRIS